MGRGRGEGYASFLQHKFLHLGTPVLCLGSRVGDHCVLGSDAAFPLEWVPLAATPSNALPH